MSNFYTLFNLKQDLDANLHGGGVSQLQNFYNTVDKGRRAMISKIRPEELIRKEYLEQAMYPNIDRYSVPDDMKYDDMIELNLLAGYRNVDTLNQPLMLVYRRRYGEKRRNSSNIVNIGYENGVKYARIFNPNRNPSDGSGTSTGCQFKLIHNCDSLSDNGSWNVGGNVVNLKEDQLNHVLGNGSFSFDIDGSSTTGFLENFTLTSFTLADFLQKGATFAWLDIPLPKDLLSVKMTMGSDTGNLLNDLYESTVNQPHDNNEFNSGWNLLKFMLNNLTTVGTPDPSALAYIRFDFVTTGNPIPNLHLDTIVARIGEVYEVTYNSSWCFMDAQTKQIKKFPTANSDIIIAEEDTYNILLLETTLAAQKEIYGSAGAAKSDVYDAESELNGVRTSRGIIIKPGRYAQYNQEHKSEGLMFEDDTYIFGNIFDGFSDVPMSDGNVDNGIGGVQAPNQP